MGAIRKFQGFIEYLDGREIIGFRVGLKTKIQAEKTARAQGWKPEADAATMNAFMAWHAAHEQGLITEKWAEFVDAVMDASTVEMEDDGAAAEDSDDPTEPAASAGH